MPDQKQPFVPLAPKKKFLNGKIIATFLGLLLLVGGVGAGIYLTQQQQIFQPKAGGGGARWCKQCGCTGSGCVNCNKCSTCPDNSCVTHTNTGSSNTTTGGSTGTGGGGGGSTSGCPANYYACNIGCCQNNTGAGLGNQGSGTTGTSNLTENAVCDPANGTTGGCASGLGCSCPGGTNCHCKPTGGQNPCYHTICPTNYFCSGSGASAVCTPNSTSQNTSTNITTTTTTTTTTAETASPTATVAPTETATPGPTATPTGTETSAPASTATPQPSGVPNSCNGTCGSNINCESGLFCYQGFCRKSECPTAANCTCSGAPAPTKAPTLPSSGTDWPTVATAAVGILVIIMASLLFAI